MNNLERGRALVDEVNPGMEEVLEQKYGKFVPGINARNVAVEVFDQKS